MTEKLITIPCKSCGGRRYIQMNIIDQLNQEDRYNLVGCNYHNPKKLNEKFFISYPIVNRAT